jgi:CO/xanthine dehydrogenase FAD-binding subunit
MRSYVPAYDLRVPATLEQALDLLAEPPGRWKPFAGGTDLMVVFESGRLEHTHYVSVGHLADLRFISESANQVAIGATATYTDVRRHPLLASEFPMLCAAAAETGGLANQNRGTLGGNIANASPAADSPPALLAYDAELELVSTRGSRRVPYDRFHTGYKTMDLAPDELIRAIHLPRRAARRHFYRKVGTRRAQAISKVCIAGVIELDRNTITYARIAIGSVAPTVIRARNAETAVTGKPLNRETIIAAISAVASDISPIDDIRSTKRYRTAVSANLVEELLTSFLAASVQ